jgi:2'-5' RNA ligase
LRLFFSGEIPDAQIFSLRQIQEMLQKVSADVKWVDPKNFHITFSFLGEVKSERLDSLKRTGEEVQKLFHNFPVSFSQLGAFPSRNKPKIIWLGIEQGEEILDSLAKELERRLLEQKFTLENREFKPHLTLGRIRSQKGIEKLSEKLNLHFPESAEFLFTHFSLKESHLKPGGAVYKTIFDFPLKNP